MLFRPINVYNFILSLAAILPKQILKTINYETAFLFLNTRFIYTDQFEQEKKCMNLLNRHMPCGFSHRVFFIPVIALSILLYICIRSFLGLIKHILHIFSVLQLNIIEINLNLFRITFNPRMDVAIFNNLERLI